LGRLDGGGGLAPWSRCSHRAGNTLSLFPTPPAPRPGLCSSWPSLPPTVRHASADVALSLRQGYCYFILLATATGFTPETWFTRGFYRRFGVSPVAAHAATGLYQRSSSHLRPGLLAKFLVLNNDFHLHMSRI